jgi:PEP-CTERM motif
MRDNVVVSDVPEPASFAPLGVGAAALGMIRRRRTMSHIPRGPVVRAAARLRVAAAVLSICAFPLVAQAYPQEIIDFNVNGFSNAGSGSGEIVLDVANSHVLQFNMAISGLTADGFPTDTVSFSDPSLVTFVDHEGGPTAGYDSITFSYDTGNTSGFYVNYNFVNRFFLNDGPSHQAWFATVVTSDVIDTPEPASLALLGLGAGALAMIRRRRGQV